MCEFPTVVSLALTCRFSCAYPPDRWLKWRVGRGIIRWCKRAIGSAFGVWPGPFNRSGIYPFPFTTSLGISSFFRPGPEPFDIN